LNFTYIITITITIGDMDKHKDRYTVIWWDNQIWREGDTYGALPMPMVVPLQYIATHIGIMWIFVVLGFLSILHWERTIGHVNPFHACMHILPGSLLPLAAKASTVRSTWSELVKVKAYFFERKKKSCGHALYCSRSEEAAAGADAVHNKTKESKAKAKLAKHAVHDRYAMRNCQWHWHACDPAWFLASCWTGLDCIYSFAQTMQRGDAKRPSRPRAAVPVQALLAACLPACLLVGLLLSRPGPAHRMLCHLPTRHHKNMTFQFPQTYAHDTV
jgi:hypothetical protein